MAHLLKAPEDEAGARSALLGLVELCWGDVGLLLTMPRQGLGQAAIAAVAVELVKLALGVHSRTGDLFAVPVCVGIAIGRLGCFFAGLAEAKAATLSELI